MSADKELRAKLRRLAGASPETAGGWRRLPATQVHDVLRAVAMELDETVLPRRLLLRNGAGEVLTLAAGHRRLRQLVAPPPPDFARFAPLFGPQALDEAQPSELAALLRRFAGEPVELWVRSETLAAHEAGAASGISATALAVAWDLSLEENEQEPVVPVLERFRDALSDQCIGWVLSADGAGTPAFGGSFADAAPDDSLLQAWWAQAGALAPGIAVFRGEPEGAVTVLATDGSRSLLLRLNAGTTRDICAAWQRVSGDCA